MHRLAVALVTLVVFCLPPTTAHAETEEDAATATVGYRWQVALADGAALAMFVGASSRQSPTAGALGIGTYFTATPIIHAAHGRGGRALLSLGLRLTLPLAAGLAGEKWFKPSCPADANGFCGDASPGPRFFDGLAVGALVAVVVDVALLSRPIAATERLRPAKPAWTPGATVARGGVLLGASRGF